MLSLLSPSGLPPFWVQEVFRVGRDVATAYEKRAEAVSEPEVSYNLSGVLQLSSSGWLLLTVPNVLVYGVFSAMREPGIELPPGPGGRLNAHISVMSKEEVAKIGPDKITERGKSFHYTLGRFYAVEPSGWPSVAKAYFIRVSSPQLQELRLSYGLSALPSGGAKPFHITCAVKQRGVLGRNEKSRAA